VRRAAALLFAIKLCNPLADARPLLGLAAASCFLLLYDDACCCCVWDCPGRGAVFNPAVCLGALITCLPQQQEKDHQLQTPD
jgi:hypothetical protein